MGILLRLAASAAAVWVATLILPGIQVNAETTAGKIGTYVAIAVLFGRIPHLAGWSLGGIFAVYAAAAHPDLPLRSLTPIASPFDLRRVPLFATLRPLDRLFGPFTVAPLYRLVGTVPAPLTSLGFKAASVDKYLTRPWTVLANLDDRDHLEQIEAGYGGGALTHDRCRRAARRGRRQELMRIEPLAAQGDEQGSRHDGPRVGGDAREGAPLTRPTHPQRVAHRCLGPPHRTSFTRRATISRSSNDTFSVPSTW